MKPVLKLTMFKLEIFDFFEKYFKKNLKLNRYPTIIFYLIMGFPLHTYCTKLYRQSSKKYLQTCVFKIVILWFQKAQNGHFFSDKSNIFDISVYKSKPRHFQMLHFNNILTGTPRGKCCFYGFWWPKLSICENHKHQQIIEKHMFLL